MMGQPNLCIHVFIRQCTVRLYTPCIRFGENRPYRKNSCFSITITSKQLFQKGNKTSVLDAVMITMASFFFS